MLYSDIDSIQEFNIRLQDKSLTLLLGKEKEITFSSTHDGSKHVYPLTVSLGKETKTLNINFIPPFHPSFSKNYKKRPGTIVIENTPLYELVNVVYAITEKGSRDNITFNTYSPYFKEVQQYFAPYKDHPIVKLINKDYKQFDASYRMMRESAYNYSFKGDKIVVSGPYQNFEEGNTVFDHLELWEDFAQKSKFRQFYADHKQLYEEEIAKAKAHLPLRQMWSWCEGRFAERYQTYRIVISPLIEGFHSTQHVSSQSFNECVMFISRLGNFGRERTKKEIEALYSGIVFTEIDHNYVNPLSDKFTKELDNAFGSAKWVKGRQAEEYGSGKAFFNEYMTHALYLLYIQDYYTPAELATVEKSRIELMINRGFPLFREFYTYLAELYKDPQVKKDIGSAYPKLIEWGKKL